MSALASLERFGEEDLVFINWRSCRHCLQNKWPLVGSKRIWDTLIYEVKTFSCTICWQSYLHSILILKSNSSYTNCDLQIYFLVPKCASQGPTAFKFWCHKSCQLFRTPLTEGMLTKVERARGAGKLLFPDLNDDIHEGNELEMQFSNTWSSWNWAVTLMHRHLWIYQQYLNPTLDQILVLKYQMIVCLF